MKPFLSEDFLLESQSAKALYHDFAAPMPIFDYHCHLPVQEIADNTKFDNLTAIWLNGDHYKWRAMRTNGEYCAAAHAGRTRAQNRLSPFPESLAA